MVSYSSRSLMILRYQRLNPCCSGRWSRTLHVELVILRESCLNPCCNGRWSRTQNKIKEKEHRNWSLNPCYNGRWSRTQNKIKEKEHRNWSLNPCCSGQWSRTLRKTGVSLDSSNVLILVVVDDGLVHPFFQNNPT